MKILLIGDSNFRNNYVKEKFEGQTKQDVVYQQAGSTAAIITVLEDKKNENVNCFLISSFYNELTFNTKLVNETHVRDQVARTMIKAQSEGVEEAAKKHEEKFYTIMKPLRRKQPVWIGEKVTEYNRLFEDEFGEKIRPDNMALIDGPKFSDNLLGADGVHLTNDGLKVLQDYLIDQIKCMVQGTSLNEQETSVASIENDIEATIGLLTNTPNRIETRSSGATAVKQKHMKQGKKTVANKQEKASAKGKSLKRKNTITEDDEESDKETDELPELKRSKMSDLNSKMDDIMSKLESMSGGLGLMVAENKEKIELNKVLIEETKKESGQNKVCIENFANKFDKETKENYYTFARLKEETDMFENDKMTDSVIIRKFPYGQVRVDSPAEVIKHMKTVGEQLVKSAKISPQDIRYIGPAFPMDLSKPQLNPGEMPPFKIQFTSRELGIRMRQIFVDTAKKPDSHLAKVYFSHPQNASTRIRIQIMWAMVKGMRKDGKDCWVSQSTIRPSLMVKGDKFPRSYSFVQAIREFGGKADKEDMKHVKPVAEKFFKGEIEKFFIIMTDSPVQSDGRRSSKVTSGLVLNDFACKENRLEVKYCR